VPRQRGIKVPEKASKALAAGFSGGRCSSRWAPVAARKLQFKRHLESTGLASPQMKIVGGNMASRSFINEFNFYLLDCFVGK